VLGQPVDQEFDLEAYLQQNVDKESSFFVVEKAFWDSWSDTPNKRNPVKDTIDN
jgi:hypothetical protein